MKPHYSHINQVIKLTLTVNVSRLESHVFSNNDSMNVPAKPGSE